MYSIKAIAGSATDHHTVQIPHSDCTEDSILLILRPAQVMDVDVYVIFH